MTLAQMQIAPASTDPVDALLTRGTGVLAVIAGVEGPSYRPLGAMMAVFAPGHRVGTLSSGCIEADIELHAMEVAREGRPQTLRYGRGSPFIDIQLPCGGGLDILLLPAPDHAVLSDLSKARAARVPTTITIDMQTGAMAIADLGPTARDGRHLSVRFDPPIRFLVFGKGPEASTFAGLVQSAGYPNMLLSPDDETRQAGAMSGCAVHGLTGKAFPDDVSADAFTAVILFFHDHEWEPPIMSGALGTDAFYIGAQGSRRARDMRMLELEGMGVTEDQRARLRGPVGLIPSARDAGTLAVSVLAEVLSVAMAPAA